jgi:hypothetical protein
MAIANIQEAKSQLSKLVDQALNGEAVTHCQAGSTNGPAGADPYQFLTSSLGAVERPSPHRRRF